MTVDDIQVADSDFTGSGLAPVADCSGGPATLAPGEQLTCTASYTITQKDANAGGITNSATASGVALSGGARIESTPSTVVLPHDAAPALELVKTAIVSGSGIRYRFAVTNTGNVTVTDASIAEGTFSGTGAFPSIDCPAGASSMKPGEAIVCTAAYDTTDADRRAGGVTNTATAHGNDPGGPISSTSATARAALAPLDMPIGLPDTGLRLDQTIWSLIVLLIIGAVATGSRRLVRRRRD